MIGAHNLGFLESEKYLGDQISQEGTSASLKETLDKREKGPTDKIENQQNMHH